MSVVALASGCVFLPASLPFASRVPATLIGTVGISDGGVRINGEMAGNGDAVTGGDTVATGPGNSAVIDFIDGGYIHLDQNSKAIFVKKRLRHDTCNMAHMLSGQAFLDKDPFCFETPHLKALSTGLANVRVTTEQTEIVVLRGKFTLQ
ncbi:MAG: FecR domain-containing protein, partial [Sulfuricella sp.]|nr:FecR domain-containing protein [Sulfuricella sp.]